MLPPAPNQHPSTDIGQGILHKDCTFQAETLIHPHLKMLIKKNLYAAIQNRLSGAIIFHTIEEFLSQVNLAFWKKIRLSEKK
jgi:hypothetical protein